MPACSNWSVVWCWVLLVFGLLSPPAAAQDTLRVRGAVEPPAGTAPAKNPTTAVVRSLLIPGWGQYYNGQKLKAALVFGAETGLLATALYWHHQAGRARDQRYRLYYEDNRNLAYWFLAGTIVLSMLDAYVDAQLSDFDESPSLEGERRESLAPPGAVLGLRLQIKF